MSAKAKGRVTLMREVPRMSTDALREIFYHLRSAYENYRSSADSAEYPGVAYGEQPQSVRTWRWAEGRTALFLNEIALELASRPAEKGTCQFCGCHETQACAIDDCEACSWADDTQTICSHPECEARGGAA